MVQFRLQKQYPRHSPPHLIENQDYYLITAACYEHKHRLNTPTRRQELWNRLFETLTDQGIEVRAWVILPNHYHLLISTVEFKWLSQQLRLIHGRFARQWNIEDCCTGKVWCSYSDRAIPSERHYYTTLNYIHYNPVKHNQVQSPYEWHESSVHWYLKDKGREWLRSCWVQYQVRDYGKNWDNFSL
ncbi:transposase [Spirulina subsalsa FACHB-351]|uniref:Transposase n=1 Tax=Spirulina subsalsa FACHB-351 TaxID=234711 RepID=A0ABT3LBF2_9CYAN|nr:transposase [Spirulina subsalsa FACHB-351]